MNTVGVMGTVLVTSPTSGWIDTDTNYQQMLDTADSEFFMVEAVAIYVQIYIRGYMGLYIYISRG